MEKRINKIYCITMTMVKDKDEMVVDAAGNVHYSKIMHHGPTCMYISFKTKTCGGG